MKIVEYKSTDINSMINEEFLQFINSCYIYNKNINNNYYYDDFKLALNDLEANNDPFNVFIINPFFKLSFERQYKEFIDKINDIVLKNTIDKINKSMELMKRSNFDVKKLSNFPFNKLSLQILNVLFI
jgi:hypothetical protein